MKSMYPDVNAFTQTLTRHTLDLYAKFQPLRAKIVAAKWWGSFGGLTDL